ncbi:uncharacterized protein LOC136089518 isoform X2 [Hydra vulgaris]|uniref:Uncharacterized protein LOC136089518 isoform X2 n=1 Tax=Hydra vulgaris TaxID=6087 RepID=A0ABM4DB94_HYDVU
MAEDTSSLENAFEEIEESSGTFKKNKKRRVTKISYDRETENEESENDQLCSVEPKKKMLVSSALVPKPQPPCKLPSSSKSRVDDQLQHDIQMTSTYGIVNNFHILLLQLLKGQHHCQC